MVGRAIAYMFVEEIGYIKGNMFGSGMMVGINLHVLEWRKGRRGEILTCFGVEGWLEG